MSKNVTKAFIIKGSRQKEISAELAIHLMKRYSVAGVAYNKGQIIYLLSGKGQRIHSIVIQEGV